MVLNYFEAVLDWCKVKIPLGDKNPGVLFKEGEIWWCKIGINVGKEIYGKGKTFSRPVLVFKKFNEYTFMGLPVIGHEKAGEWYVLVKMVDRIGSIAFDQARVFDSKRMIERILVMRDADFEIVQERFHALYCPKKSSPRPTGDGDRWDNPNNMIIVADQPEKSNIF